ncbi:hypothetical protein LHK_01139 [Laribacter hongkongensis HLHK9]|uniref:Uncharacterized protein n=1 Tax=Laribacter hongkongensis (strain HLHK9) TaxID=557598 RepID=C1D6M4_LARHH|nr:hypothetical protein LHK_01139 [Laribacter hongkongensis HLHK9]
MPRRTFSSSGGCPARADAAPALRPHGCPVCRHLVRPPDGASCRGKAAITAAAGYPTPSMLVVCLENAPLVRHRAGIRMTHEHGWLSARLFARHVMARMG